MLASLTRRLALLLFALVTIDCATARPRKTATPAPSLPLLEDELGVAGAPTDSLEFEFEPETNGNEPPNTILDGLDEPSADTMARLAPYLDSRRAYLQSASTDGSSFVVVTRLEGVAQAYQATLGQPGLRPITAAEGPIIQISRAPGVDGWVYRSEVRGTEDYQVSLLDQNGTRLITDGESRHGPFSSSTSGVLAFAGNARNGRDMDIYLALAGRKPEVALEREGAWSVSAWSPDNRHMLLREYVSFLDSAFWVFAPQTGKLQRVGEPSAKAVRGRFSAPSRLHLTSDGGGEFLHLWEVSWPDGAFTNLTPDLTWDVDELATVDGGRVQAYTTNEGGVSGLWLRSEDGTKRLDLPKGAIVSNLRFVRGGAAVAFTMDRATDTGDVYLLDVESGALDRATTSRSKTLDYARFVEPEPAALRSFDDVEVPMWVYRPRQQTEPAPVLLWIHGGPEAQHEPAFHPLIQFLVTELGIAVVAPNIRGSSGYGRTYVSLDDGPLREDAIRDVGAVLDWVGEHPALDATRIGIFGASYGGFVVLASLVRYGERLAAGADQVGISNVVTFLENTRDYRVDQRRPEYGDERDPEMRALLEELSPINSAELIRSPLFVAHGANDPRVPVDEARAIVAAVRDNGGDASLMVATDEGHSFRRRANRDQFYGALVEFFAEHLGASLDR